MRFDFPTIMVALVFVTGGIWLVDTLFFAAGRKRAAFEEPAEGDLTEEERKARLALPALVDFSKSFFPVFLIVLVLRSFLLEPFRIPSASMMPTLLIGDFIVVNKYTYGIRLPVVDTKIVEIGRPERGDVVVFRFPEDPSIPFIKRIVGLPGDSIRYQDKSLYINGEPALQRSLGVYSGYGSGAGFTGANIREEMLGERKHDILVQGNYSIRRDGEWVVPQGQYFVLGDNRDNSRDSRFWGFVPDELLIGKAFSIWMNWDWGHGINWGRIGNSIP